VNDPLTPDMRRRVNAMAEATLPDLMKAPTTKRPLTELERPVVDAWARGDSAKDIAAALGLSVTAVMGRVNSARAAGHTVTKRNRCTSSVWKARAA